MVSDCVNSWINMGCCISVQGLDHDRIHSAIVLQAKGETARYHGTTERNRFQVLISLSIWIIYIIMIFFY